jgi:hypothetical protein
LETIARFQRAGRLTLHGEFETAFQNIARFDSRCVCRGTTVPASISTSMFSVT